MAILDFHDSGAGVVKPQEVFYLSDLVRGAARRTLATERYLLMTRENIQEMLPQGRSLADCVGDCAVETGRKIGADFVVTGDVTSFGGQVRVTVNLHEVGSGNLLGQVVAGAPNVLGVEADLKMKVLDLLAPLRVDGEAKVGREANGGRIGGGASAWTAVGAAKIVIAFSSDPPGAMVEVDGQPIGETPCAKAMAVGVYRVGIKKVRYVAHEQALDVKAGTPANVTVALVPDFGWLTIESVPAGMPVTVDNEPVGDTPLTALEVSPGSHEVMTRGDSYHDEGQRVFINRGERVSVSLAPVPRNGGITVIATDVKGSAVDALVAVGGTTIGKAYEPLTLIKGKHLVSVESSTGLWQGEVMVIEEEMTEVAVTVQAKSDHGPIDKSVLRMVTVPAGSFVMGSPESEYGREGDEVPHKVTFAQPFQISAVEVTQALYQDVTGVNPSESKRAELPVTNVSWLDAVEFCNRLSDREGLMRAYHIIGGELTWDSAAPGYRLPTEAEWEYACRAGSPAEYSGGRGIASLKRSAWFGDNSGGKPQPVATLMGNLWRIYDMHGNVWEWCWDSYGPYVEASRPTVVGVAGESMKVNRGGGWFSTADACRSAERSRNAPSFTDSNLGFRIARNAIR